MNVDRFAVLDLYAEYGARIDNAEFDEWLALFAVECRYQVMPWENERQGLPAALVYCENRAMLEDRIMALLEANKYNIHTDRHLIGLPRVIAAEPGGLSVEAPFAVFQSDQEGASRLFATGLYRDRLGLAGGSLKFSDKKVLLDTFAVPSLLSSPL